MEKNIDFYLSRGFDRAAAEYFAGGRKRIAGVTPNDDFTLNIHFDNGETRLYDVAPLIQSDNVFAPLMDPERFRAVYVDNTHCIAWDIDPEIDSSVVWNNKIDLCPDTCYIDSVPLANNGAHMR